MPTFSIITATRNAEQTLPRRLDSLAAQTCRDFNVIIQDCLSQDATPALAQKYQEQLPEILVHSEADSGIYDAWNKALDRRHHRLGEWILFLGADDLLAAPDVLERSRTILSALSEDVLYCCGDLVLFSEDTLQERFVEADMQTSFASLGRRMTVAHSALYHRKSVFSHARFDATFRIAGDYDFLAKTWQLSLLK